MIIAFYPGGGGNRYLQLLSNNDWSQHGVSYDKTNQQDFEHRYLLNPGSIKKNKKNNHILTHCMNSKMIKKLWPDQEILFIKSNLKKSLCREWTLHGHDRYVSTVDHTAIPRLEHYNAIRDQHWPEISSVSMLKTLPVDILKEVNQNYNLIIKQQGSSKTKLEKLTQDCVIKIESCYEDIVWHKDYYHQYPEDFSSAQQVIDIDTDKNEFAVFMREELALYPSEIYDKTWSIIYE
jgi:hypothetical protein